MRKLQAVIALKLLVSAFLAVPGVLQAQGNDSLQSKFNNIRKAFALRELDRAGTLLQEAEMLPGAANNAELERLKLLENYLTQFWKSVSEGAKSLDALDELVIGETRIAVVEVTSTTIIIRVAGVNRRYSREDLPPKLAVALAQRAFSRDKQNLVFIATFHVGDKAGDRIVAAQLLNEAKQAGVSVDPLPAELAVARPVVVEVEIPPMTPAMRSLLAPGRWIEMKEANSRLVRTALTEAQQNDEGHLVIPTAKEARIVAFETRLAANFGCRLVLRCEAAEVRFGLYEGDSAGGAIAVAVPAGTHMIELGRQRGQWQCRLNSTPTEVSVPEGSAPATAGYLGFDLPKETSCEILAYELRVR